MQSVAKGTWVMDSKGPPAIPHLLVVLFVLFASLAILSRSAAAQIPYIPAGVEVSGDATSGFDPETKENFYWDKDAHVWRNTKTGKAVGSYYLPGSKQYVRREISDKGIPYIPAGVEVSGDATAASIPRPRKTSIGIRMRMFGEIRRPGKLSAATTCQDQSST